jgi:actin-related protein 8
MHRFSLLNIFRLTPDCVAIQCIFEPRVIDFDSKRVEMRTISHQDITEEIIEHAGDHAVSFKLVCYQDNFQPFNRLRL